MVKIKEIVRTVTIDNEPWFVAKDVCDALGIGNPNVNVVSEGGMYTLVIRFRK
ncbi:hypothetical protein CAV59_15660 [Salmonella enterica]|nr:hypothetical protein [Salmonella enterica]ECC5258280.1 Bro-N domain-containing protein [Salmonella enterica]MIL91325.1 hypothetical protein [Salmonella enterica]